MKATQQLKDEHEGIRLMLNIMDNISTSIENGKELNINHFERILDFLKVFVDKCHHGKEEDILFPDLVVHGLPKEGGPIGVMLKEHQLGREHIKSISTAFNEYKSSDKPAITRIISGSRDYVELLRNHIEKENNILFIMADKALDESEQSKLFDDFEKLEIEKIGQGKHEEYHKLLKELKNIYLQ
jgi:hemerythrin-like domain-containing protein